MNQNAGPIQIARAVLQDRRGGDVAAVALGALLPLAFAPFDLWPLAMLSPAGLFLLWRDCDARGGFRRGWMFGLGMWGAGVYWIYHSLHLFGDAIAPIAAVLTAVFAAGMALTLGMLGWLVCRVDSARRDAAWLLLMLPAGWIALEWVRSWLLTGFPWLLLGTPALETWLAGYLPVFVVYATGLLMVLGSGALVALSTPGTRRAGIGVTVLLSAAWIGGMLLDGHNWTRTGGPPVEVALVQGNIDQASKFNTLAETMDFYTQATREVAGEAGLVVWPETAVPTFYTRVDTRMNEFAREMAAHGTEVVTGVFVYDDETGRYYNSVRPIGPDREDYRKRHLVPFGEYLPLRGALMWAAQYIRIPMSDIAAGPVEQPPLTVGGYALSASVCYEAAYPDTVRRLARGSGILINVSNDAWFGDSTAPFQHLQLARVRALENGRPMLRATNTGISAVIGPGGEVVATTPQFEVGTVRAVVRPRWGDTPWMRWGSWPVLFAVALMLVAGPALYRLRARPDPERDSSGSHRG